MGFFNNVGSAFKKLGGNIQKTVNKVVPDFVQDLYKPISKVYKTATQDIMPQLLKSQLGNVNLNNVEFNNKKMGFNINQLVDTIGEVTTSNAANQLGSFVQDNNYVKQLFASTSKIKKQSEPPSTSRQTTLPSGTTLKAGESSKLKETYNSVKDWIIKNSKALLIGLGALILVIIIWPLVFVKKKAPKRRTKRRITTTAKQRQLDALAKGRRTRARNLRLKRAGKK